MNSSSAPSDKQAREQQMKRALRLDSQRTGRRWLRRTIWALLVMAVVATGIYLWKRPRADQGPSYETAPVTRGDLHITVTATGTLSARDSVQVGAEISGRVLKVLVDFNDKVKTGQVLAEIDPEQYQARLDDARAQLAAARASRENAVATVNEAKLQSERLRSMREAGLSSQQELETSEATYARAVASVQSAKAQITSASASLKVAESNLKKAIIRSPIDGIVLERSVEPGQTVTSGLQTPVLFTLAADLAELRLDVKVDEADVGQVSAGQKATFTVDAYPNRTFDSTVMTVKNMPTTEQNVVTYETRLSVNNEQGLLRPGMTATANIMVDDKKGVLLVPNAALRFAPKLPTAAPKSSGFSVSRILPGPPRHSSPSPAASAQASTGTAREQHAIWLLDHGQPKRVPVTMGRSDGARTEVESSALEPGMRVITDETGGVNG